MPHLALALSALVVLLACSNSPSAPRDRERLPSTTVLSAQYTGIASARREVIRDPGAWRGRWSEIHSGASPEPSLPAVDFGRDMLVLVALGTRGNGCFDVEIAAVERAGDRLQVDAVEQVPGTACVCTDALVHPVHVVRTPRRDLPAAFEIVERTLDCS